MAASADRASITADGRDLAYVEVDIDDAQGVVVPKANNTIAVSLTGPGTLVGLDAGDSTNHDSYKGTSHAAFSGKLMAIIRFNDDRGNDHLDRFLRVSHRRLGGRHGHDAVACCRSAARWWRGLHFERREGRGRGSSHSPWAAGVGVQVAVREVHERGRPPDVHRTSIGRPSDIHRTAG